jgi:hypothetical protein
MATSLFPIPSKKFSREKCREPEPEEDDDDNYFWNGRYAELSKQV